MLFIKSDHDFSQVDSITYDKEDQMQSYIYENPKLLPVEELTGNKKLLVLIRELSTDYGRLDGLGIDEAGNLYIIETKLLRNPDRRNIIAQMLDYGVALWTEYKDPQELINYLSHKNINIKQLVLDTFETSEELADIIVDKFKANLKSGIYQFVAVTDAVEKRILDQIHFINQNSNFSFFLVDLRFYTHDGVEFIIPKGYGGEIIKNTSGGGGASTRAGDELEFLDTLESNMGLEARTLIQNIIYSFSEHGFVVEYRQGKTPTVRIYQNKKDFFLVNIYSKNGDIILYRNTKTTGFDRWEFYKRVFGIDFTTTDKINYTIKYDEYRAKLSEGLKYLL